MRLEFYESYLRPRAWREDAVNLAPVTAVLSFLRHSDGETYGAVMTQAAAYAADWWMARQPWHVRTGGRLLPLWMRLRQVGTLSKRHFETSYRGTKVRVRVRRRRLELEIRGSIFCSSREQAREAHCGYYLAFVQALLAHDASSTMAPWWPVGPSAASAASSESKCQRRRWTTTTRLATVWLLALVPDVRTRGRRTRSSCAAPPACPSVLVMPSVRSAMIPRARLLGEGWRCSSRRVTAVGRPPVPAPIAVLAFNTLELPATASSRARPAARRPGHGLRDLVTGTVGLTAETITVAGVRAVEAGRGHPEIREPGPLPDVVAIAGRVAAAIAGVPAAAAPVGNEPPPSLEVFEAFVKGLVAETPATQLRFLEQAVKAAPQYARAHLAIWDVCTEQEQHGPPWPRRGGPASSASARARFC